MPSQLNKVTKHISKKKGSIKKHALNENSRDAHRLQRAGDRDEKVSRASALKVKHDKRLLARIAFFKDSLPPPADKDATKPGLDQETIHAHIRAFLSRSDPELAQLKTDRRPGRPPSTRQVLLDQLQTQEQSEYQSGGFWMPDLLDGDNVVALRSWSGLWDALGQIKFVRVAEGGRVDQSAFPPRGAV